ncbi:spermatogenesis-associated protein 7 homolog isoform X2 [Babylonia areolata]|uniref:spermatogenesis-associated protein 7 homolog isoform X2 n=1 Tax=Babylonia areolata TaxID=304850 RepID=UPI003FD3CD0C
MAASLRGQLGVKSSPLSPTSSKLTTQMLVISHMDNHYKKISKAKPAIDNAPPKSMLSSQKLRDRQVRKRVEKYGSRPSSRSMYRSGSAQDIYDEQQWSFKPSGWKVLKESAPSRRSLRVVSFEMEEPEDEEERQVRDIMRTTLRVPLKAEQGVDSVDATAGSRSESAAFGTTTMRPGSARVRGVTQAMAGAAYLGGRTRPMSARSTTSMASNLSHTSRSTNPLKVTYNGDVLNKHAHSFTEPTKPFTPRTLKSNRESSLKRYKYYTPPPRKSQPSNQPEEAAVEEEETRVKQVPQAKPRHRPSRGDLGATETLTETMLMDMSLQSHDPRQPGDGHSVPRLDISMDKDHLSWMQEQATRAQIRVRNGSGSGSGSARVDGGDTLQQTGTLGQSDTLRFTRTASSSKEEEQKYVTFAHEVTQDIVSRNISSDRVLQKIFENHIERKKGELDERRLRAIITDISRDLGVQHVAEPLERKTVQYSEDLEQTATLQGGETTTMDTLDSTSTTLHANNTFNFDRTTDMLSTIHSQRGEEGAEDELSATAALREYQMTLTNKVDAEEENSAISEGLDQTLTTDKGTTLGSTLANGEVDTESEDASQNIPERGSVEEHRPSPRPRCPRGQTAGTAAQESGNLSRQASITDTEARSEIEEEEVEEEYEDDYDADDDDNQAKASDDEF